MIVCTCPSLDLLQRCIVCPQMLHIQYICYVRKFIYDGITNKIYCKLENIEFTYCWSGHALQIHGTERKKIGVKKNDSDDGRWGVAKSHDVNARNSFQFAVVIKMHLIFVLHSI